jgi:ribonuclease VapC
MKKKCYILDSFALLSYFGDEVGAQKVEQILRDAENGKLEVFICTINLGEIFYITYRMRGEKCAEEIMGIVAQLPIIEVNPTREIILSAARLKAKTGVAYADCFAASTAIERKGIVVTGDSEFKKLEKIVKVLWI